MKTVHASELSTIRMAAGNENRFRIVVDEGRRMHWIGIGWVDEGPATPKDCATYPTVVRSTPARLIEGSAR